MGEFPVTFETGKHYQVHKSYIWLGPLLALITVVLIFVLNSIGLIVEIANELGAGRLNVLIVILVCIGGLLLLYGLTVLLYALAYKNMSYVFDEREFSFYSGIITKRRVHVPYARVQSVNHKASVFQRLAGVCSVTIDSAGGAQNKAVRVPYLQLGVAERLRVDLFVRKAAVEAGREADIVYRPEADPTTQLGAAQEAAYVAQQRGAAPEAPWQVQPGAGGGGQGMPQSAGMPQGAGAVSGAGIPQVAGMPQGTQSAAGSQANVLDSVAGGLAEFRGVWGGSVAGLEPVSYEYGLSNRELLFTSFSHSTPVVLAISIGLTALITVLGISSAGDEVARMVAMLSVPIVVASFVGSYALGILGIAISYGNFRARRRGSRIEVERGLLQRSFSGIDIDRVQSVEIRQSVIRRIIGYCELSLGRIDVNNGDASNQNSNLDARGLVVHPFVKLRDVDAILDNLAPELVGRPRVETLQKLPPVVMRRALLRNCVWFNWAFWTAIVAIVARAVALHFLPSMLGHPTAASMAAASAWIDTAFWSVIAVCVVYTVLAAVHATLWARGSGYAWNRNFVVLRNDGLYTSYIAIPRTKVQSGNTRSNPFQRRLNLATVVATTAAGTSLTATRLLDLPTEQADAFIDWLKPGHASQ